MPTAETLASTPQTPEPLAPQGLDEELFNDYRDLVQSTQELKGIFSGLKKGGTSIKPNERNFYAEQLAEIGGNLETLAELCPDVDFSTLQNQVRETMRSFIGVRVEKVTRTSQRLRMLKETKERVKGLVLPTQDKVIITGRELGGEFEKTGRNAGTNASKRLLKAAKRETKKAPNENVHVSVPGLQATFRLQMGQLLLVRGGIQHPEKEEE